MLTILTLCSCRSRKKLKEISTIKTEDIFKKNLDSIVVKKDSIIQIVEKKKDVVKIINENNGDIIIKGKTDSLTPFTYHNVVEGDTLSSVTIKGNAEFTVKNEWKKAQEIEKESYVEKDINIIAQVARTAVSKETIKKAAQEIRNVTTEVKSTGFPLAIYIIAGIVAVCLILIASFWTQIKGYFSFLNIFKKNKNG